MPALKRRRLEGSEFPSYDGADEVKDHNIARNEEEIQRTAQEMHLNWSVSTDLKRYLSHASPEDFVKRINSLITPDMAATIFNRYVTQLAPHVPAVVFPAGTTAEQVRNELSTDL